MSAPAIKSSMPGVGASPSSTGHSMLPINMMAQKVVPVSESSSGMKPLTSSGLSYVTLQPANHPQQPLSLVQDHRPPVYQTPSTYSTNNAEKEAESEKVIHNGVDSGKSEPEQEQPVLAKPNESSRNNNLSPENPSQEQETQEKKLPESQSETELVAVKADTSGLNSRNIINYEIHFDLLIFNIPLIFLAVSTPAQSKPEEKKSPVNNGSKELEAKTAAPTSTLSKTAPSQKVEETPPKSEAQKPKPQTSITKSAVESTATTAPKLETKVASTSRATKRKPRELKDLKGAAAGGGPKPKRNRIKTQPYQSPLPEIAMIVKTLNKPVSTKAPDDKLIVFYKCV